MKKMPTLFHRGFQNLHVISISQDVTPGLEWVLAGEGMPTEKIDGACCAIINGVFYKRYDAKKDKRGNRINGRDFLVIGGAYSVNIPYRLRIPVSHGRRTVLSGGRFHCSD